MRHTNWMFTSLGYQDLHDFLSTIFVPTNFKIMASFALVFGYFQNLYLWDDPDQIVFIWVLLLVDLFTGVGSAIKTKTFNSRRLPRWAGISFTYSLLLFLSANMAKYAPAFSWLPNSLYTLFCAVLFVSLVENLNKLGWLDIKIYNYIKDKFNNIISPKDKNIKED